MGKKKKNKEQEGDYGRRHGLGAQVQPHTGFEMPPHVAGIAAAALKQVNTPVFKQLIAGALGGAAQVFEQRHRAATPPSSPGSPVPQKAPEASDAPEPSAVRVTRQADFDVAELQLSPETAEAIDKVARQAAQVIERAADSAGRAIDAAAKGFEDWVEQRIQRRTAE